MEILRKINLRLSKSYKVGKLKSFFYETLISVSGGKNDKAEFFTWTRFDLGPKRIFLNLLGKETDFGENIYKEHLKIWNDFKEFDKPEKNSYEIFRTDFINIYNDLDNGSFDWRKSPVEIDVDGNLLNGAHRASAAIKLGIAPKTKISIEPRKCFNYKFFRNLGLSNQHMDAAALEIIRNNTKVLVVNIFPSAVGNREKLTKVLEDFSFILYEKAVTLNRNGALNYVAELYKNEDWVGDWNNDFKGLRNKTNHCFPNDDDLTVFFVQMKKGSSAIKMKDEIRTIYNIEKHSVHINDTYEETLRLSRCLLNKNSVHFLNNRKAANFMIFRQLLEKYENEIKRKRLDIEEYCITASGVLSLYGLREAADLDYLHSGPKLKGGNFGLISSHNDYGKELYQTTYDEIIFNPKNHFYFGNLKVASLDVVRALKSKRGEEKDEKDLALMKQFFD